MIFSFIFIGADVVFDFVVQEYHVQMIELIIDDTMIGGVTNAGFKRYVNTKSQNNCLIIET